MRHALIMLALAAAPAPAFAQDASTSETDTVAKIAECLVQGPPNDWQRLTMLIEVEKPGDEAARGRYLATGPKTRSWRTRHAIPASRRSSCWEHARTWRPSAQPGSPHGS